MTRFSKSITVVLALSALALSAGCEKRPTGFDPNPNAPEGVTSPNARLLAYRNAALRVLVRDYASARIDSVAVGAQAFPGPTDMPLLMLLDGTQANTFDLYRRSDAGKFERTADYPLQSVTKFVSAGYEMFFSTDPSPGDFSPPTYLARGLVNGVASHQSPLTNEGRLATPVVQPITYNGDLQPLDSLFVVSWVGVPGAVGYWVHIYEKPIAGGQRLLSSLPSPIAYLTAGDLFLGYRAGNVPGGSVQFRLGDTSLLTLESRNPLLGRDYIVRVSGVDANGQVIAQTPGDLDSLALSPDIAYLAPPSYSLEKTKVFFSLGGTKVARRRLVPRITEGDVAQASAPASDATIQHNVPMVRFPYTTPFQYSTSARRAGHR